MPDSVQPFLEELGRRLRAAREERGLTVSALARKSELSRRFLTETEAGRANPSLAVLVRLSRALGLTPKQLLDVAPEPRAAARERIALVGLRGAGKTTVGKLLARSLEVPFVELDRRVEEAAGLSLGEIFDLAGSEVFHRYEAESLERVLGEGERVVIAAGGSIVASERNFARLRESCRTVWLRASPEEHMGRVLAQGDRRPMEDRPRAMEELRSILAQREPSYSQCELSVETDGRSAEELVKEMRARLEM